MKTIKLLMAVLVVSALFASCAQEGPVGPQGATGNNGLTGPTGNNGINGANPIIIHLDTATTTAWLKSASDTSVYYCQFIDDSISNFIADDVSAFVQGTGTSTDFFALPITKFLAGGDALTYSYNTNSITFYYSYTTGRTVPPAVSLIFKVVIIPPAVMKQHPGLNLKDYHAVMAVYNQQKANK